MAGLGIFTIDENQDEDVTSTWVQSVAQRLAPLPDPNAQTPRTSLLGPFPPDSQAVGAQRDQMAPSAPLPMSANPGPQGSQASQASQAPPALLRTASVRSSRAPRAPQASTSSRVSKPFHGSQGFPTKNRMYRRLRGLHLSSKAVQHFRHHPLPQVDQSAQHGPESQPSQIMQSEQAETDTHAEPSDGTLADAHGGERSTALPTTAFTRGPDATADSSTDALLQESAPGPSRNSAAQPATTSSSSDAVPVELAESLARQPPRDTNDEDDMAITPAPPLEVPDIRPNPRTAKPESLVMSGPSTIPGCGDGLFTKFPVARDQIIFEEVSVLRAVADYDKMSGAWNVISHNNQQRLMANYPDLEAIPGVYDRTQDRNNRKLMNLLQTHSFEERQETNGAKKSVFHLGSKANHACPAGPNSRVRSQVNATMECLPQVKDDVVFARFKALRDLEAGEEIFIDYISSPYFRCLCSVCEERRAKEALKKLRRNSCQGLTKVLRKLSAADRNVDVDVPQEHT
ncbi:uncharacterized protein VDAG_03316 [Verticillium dahliae VdLs.17]|uniref:SET domain-containing protein n=1 Tax=Verticillium dahliae (strain VdLs.17 / ATCC MYA-4575 / FGSC 10137) TaxID=498257 RepID=G2WZ74_VERDV|nr:uncharacterized protein VDAG_03316 [Verticillium dahliae VdLs.17]EGY21876.1 hypothetical protein VDAG_03316 [Verticillium dahliae VdLs.17]KAH6703713.1 hypothetical protein EV126DRAFT_360142 [Verticillium dahliae]